MYPCLLSYFVTFRCSVSHRITFSITKFPSSELSSSFRGDLVGGDLGRRLRDDPVVAPMADKYVIKYILGAYLPARNL